MKGKFFGWLTKFARFVALYGRTRPERAITFPDPDRRSEILGMLPPEN